MNRPGQSLLWFRSTSTTLVVAVLLCLAALNIVQRATWSEVEDGVLWRARDGAVVAAEIAPGTAADRAGIHRGDILLAIGEHEIVTVADKSTVLHASKPGERLSFLIQREGTRETLSIA